MGHPRASYAWSRHRGLTREFERICECNKDKHKALQNCILTSPTQTTTHILMVALHKVDSLGISKTIAFATPAALTVLDHLGCLTA
eukprot:COSAG01_NODE_193_length_22433_cov_91.669114_17_plen_86_part_00